MGRWLGREPRARLAPPERGERRRDPACPPIPRFERPQREVQDAHRRGSALVRPSIARQDVEPDVRVVSRRQARELLPVLGGQRVLRGERPHLLAADERGIWHGGEHAVYHPLVAARVAVDGLDRVHHAAVRLARWRQHLHPAVESIGVLEVRTEPGTLLERVVRALVHGERVAVEVHHSVTSLRMEAERGELGVHAEEAGRV
mmetsp:Transcript_14611/g.60955  ORF Transcript_14611/g.60955 Transcript_14611/m.60955 type:complete len:203 (-) Transcript_14611:562-1170(-)